MDFPYKPSILETPKWMMTGGTPISASISPGQVDEPWRPRAPALRPKPKHAAPGAFEVPPELLTSPARSELVVGIVQDGLNRWDAEER